MIVSDVEGIVLKSFKYGNSSLIGEVFTPEFGLRKFILKGLSSSKNAHRAILFRPPQIILFTAYLKENNDINFLSKIDTAYLYRNLQSNVKKGTLALFYVEMFRQVIYDGDVQEDLYDFFKDTLLYLDKFKFNPIQIIVFLYNLSLQIGIEPPEPSAKSGKYFDLLDADFTDTLPLHSYSLNETATATFKKFLLDKNHNSPYSSGERKSLFDTFIKYYKLRIDTFKGLHSPKIIKKVLSS